MLNTCSCPRIVNGKRREEVFNITIGKKGLSDSEKEQSFKMCSG